MWSTFQSVGSINNCSWQFCCWHASIAKVAATDLKTNVKHVFCLFLQGADGRRRRSIEDERWMVLTFLFHLEFCWNVTFYSSGPKRNEPGLPQVVFSVQKPVCHSCAFCFASGFLIFGVKKLKTKSQIRDARGTWPDTSSVVKVQSTR